MSFGALLSELVASTKGARGAVFCGHDGEFVDLALSRPQPAGCGELSEYDLKVMGAQLAAPWLSLHEGSASSGAGSPLELDLRCKGGTLLCRQLPERYYLVLLLAPEGHASRAAPTLREAARRLAQEL